ncbi:MAG: hypothetical protein J6Z35_05930 [Lachnospiraceae bacterium]|nr:hypothetical protein [Lachnospiraceae bacterium]
MERDTGGMKKQAGRFLGGINHIIERLDQLPLWWIGILLAGVMFLPILKLGEGSVFPYHDQLDESMMNYVLTARHMGESMIPEMLGGINASGLAPSAVLFVPLFRFLSPFAAFLIMYGIVFLSAFIGMYLLVKELTESSLLAVLSAGCFAMLPFYPVYGLSQAGIPLATYAFVCLLRKKKLVLALPAILFFGLTSHLVYTGYVVLGFMLLVLIIRGIFRKEIKLPLAGFGLLLLTYLIENHELVSEILLGSGSYVSHREEMVNQALPFWKTVFSVFMNSAQHADACHRKLVLPIVILLAAGAICFRKLEAAAKKRYLMAFGGFVLLFLIAIFYGICKSVLVVRFKNSVSGFLHYFQMERFYWLYPALWYAELALVFSFWGPGRKMIAGSKKDGILSEMIPLLWCALLAVAVLPTANTILHQSYFYLNVNQYNNGSGVTGYISWESYYSEDLMERIDEAIGRDKKEYAVAHLGISPAPALMHGFYTVDGYSNNYPLEYKHAFRNVIRKELEKTEEVRAYFEDWGNRCYLFNGQTKVYWMLKKGSGFVFQMPEFDLDALKALGCEYLFSGGEIADAQDMGLEFMGYYETDLSYWGIWLYGLKESGSVE